MGLTRQENKPRYIGSVLKTSRTMSKVKESRKVIAKRTVMGNVDREDFRIVEIRLKGDVEYYHSTFRCKKCYFIEDDLRIYIFK